LRSGFANVETDSRPLATVLELRYEARMHTILGEHPFAGGRTGSIDAGPLGHSVVWTQLGRGWDEDLEAAGIPKVTKDGKMDFAALRDSYVTLAAEAGANVKELQTLARHSTPVLTLNVFAKNRDERLAELAEKIGARVLPKQACAISVPRKPTQARPIDAKLLPSNDLESQTENGGGGIRTPVPRCFKTSMLRA
jgi:hypothetical protein